MSSKKIIIYNIDKEQYYEGSAGNLSSDEYPVCTKSHFIHTVMKCAEEVFPRMKSNPFWQRRDLFKKSVTETPEGEPPIHSERSQS